MNGVLFSNIKHCILSTCTCVNIYISAVGNTHKLVVELYCIHKFARFTPREHILPIFITLPEKKKILCILSLWYRNSDQNIHEFLIFLEGRRIYKTLYCIKKWKERERDRQTEVLMNKWKVHVYEEFFIKS